MITYNLKTAILFIIFSLSATMVRAQIIDLNYYDLELEVIPNKKYIQGNNKIYLKTLVETKEIILQLSAQLIIKSIRYENNGRWKSVQFSRDDSNVIVAFKNPLKKGEDLILEIVYSGHPVEAKKPPWVGGVVWSKSKNDKDWIGTSCQVQGGSTWWPCFEDWIYESDSVRLSFIIPKGLKCISNGVLIDQFDKGKNSIFVWKSRYPINPYGITMNIGSYDLIEENYTSISGKSFPIQFWHLPENRYKAEIFFPQIRDQLSFLESRLGPYPFLEEKYAAIEAPYTGMEHQTIISIDTLYRNNYLGFNWLHFHELTHEWFGNMITSSWKDFWIHEGFATYMEALYVEELKGSKHYCRFISSYYDRCLNAQPLAYHKAVNGEDVFFIKGKEINNRDYSIKGAYFLHQLRLEIGDFQFNELLSDLSLNYAEPSNRIRNIDTDYILKMTNKYTTRDLTELFSSFLYESSIPEQYSYDNFQCNIETGSEEEILKKKIGQMIIIGIEGTMLERDSKLFNHLVRNELGGIVLYERNIDPVDSYERLKEFNSDVQKKSPIPLFIAIDEEGGKVNRLKTKYGFENSVSASYLGGLKNLDSTKYYASYTAKTLNELGINVNFAPVLDLCSNIENPVIAKLERCYSEDPITVYDNAKVVIEQHKKNNVLAVVKHFPGHGSSSTDTHLGMTDVTTSWDNIELVPYTNLIRDNSCDAVMTAHIINENLDTSKTPATLSYDINQSLLRDSLRFKGLLFSDDMQMKAISKEYSLEDALSFTINSGVDILMFSHNIDGTNNYSLTELIQAIYILVQNGKISEEKIEESYSRIRNYKSRL
ncbi:MAG: glycoside hydrolase family 3 N-terminal domain-containing protein [Vicingaceae bacterium]